MNALKAAFRGLLKFAGGAISRSVGTALFVAIVFVFFGATPWELAVQWFAEPPQILINPWFRIGILIVGLSMIPALLIYNRWSRKQEVIDDLAEDISWAIGNLLNRKPPPTTPQDIANLNSDFEQWCQRVISKLENRAYFSRADQIHFQRLGFIPVISMGSTPEHKKILRELNLKLDRLREVIEWAQQRPR